MSIVGRFSENVFPALSAYLSEHGAGVLATLISVDGTSPRPVGSRMAIAPDGRYVGMITGGCAERAIAAEALACLKRGENRLVRYGAGSPYKDIVLPCGSGIDVYFEVRDCAEISLAVQEAHAARRSVQLVVDAGRLRSAVSEKPVSSDKSYIHATAIEPDYRIFVFGEGVNLLAFCRLAAQADIELRAFTPDAHAEQALAREGVAVDRIHRHWDYSRLGLDEYSALVALFHEHEWEVPILRAALNSKVDYIGALGSRKTHAQRLSALNDGAPTRRSPDIVCGPVGLDIGAQNPVEISISILAEIVAHRRRGGA